MNEATTPRLGEDTTKTNGNDAASPKGGAAPRSKDPVPEITVPEVAVQEVAAEPKQKTVKFRGLTFELPDTLPGTVAFDYAEIERGRKTVSPTFDLIESIIGRDQYDELYDKVRESKDITTDNVVEVLSGLLDDLFGAYGTEPGESSASDES